MLLYIPHKYKYNTSLLLCQINFLKEVFYTYKHNFSQAEIGEKRCFQFVFGWKRDLRRGIRNSLSKNRRIIAEESDYLFAMRRE